MVLLRTYDERSLVYHRQGRIGTYAMFWNHEAMQAGSVHALEDDDWIFPSYRESAIGLLRGLPPATVLHWWRGHPAGWWNPADYNVASICVPIAHARAARRRARVGEEAEARAGVRDRLLRRRRDERGRVPRGRELRRGHAGAADPLLQQQPVGDLDAAVCADARRGARRQGGRLRDPGRARRRRRRARRVRGDARGGRARARRRRPDVHRGGLRIASRRTGPRTTRARTSTSSASSRSKQNECLGRYERYLRRLGAARRRAREARSRTRRPRRCAPRSRRRRRSRTPDLALVFEHAYANPPRRSRPSSPSCARSSEARG